MNQLWVAYVTAFALGASHALEVDHMVAVGAWGGGRPRLRAALGFGARWALGHSLVVLLVGGALVMIGVRMPAAAAEWTELLVGLTLVAPRLFPAPPPPQRPPHPPPPSPLDRRGGAARAGRHGPGGGTDPRYPDSQQDRRHRLSRRVQRRHHSGDERLRCACRGGREPGRRVLLPRADRRLRHRGGQLPGGRLVDRRGRHVVAPLRARARSTTSPRSAPASSVRVSPS